MQHNLFDVPSGAAAEALAAGIALLPRFTSGADMIAPLQCVLDAAPLRHMRTPGGRAMSVAMTNCGRLGWVSDRQGYRYSATDPATDRPWPAMPAPLRELATAAALCAGFEDFIADACLVNRYAPGTRLGLHQDCDERDFSQPIVSVSLGLPATFLIGGLTRRGRLRHIRLDDGDVIVFGGPARLIYHGVKPLEAGEDPVLGAYRFNLTFRKAS
jgi:alkylated DNA repair protein (DNA oxidative demethylase)